MLFGVTYSADLSKRYNRFSKNKKENLRSIKSFKKVESDSEEKVFETLKKQLKKEKIELNFIIDVIKL